MSVKPSIAGGAVLPGDRSLADRHAGLRRWLSEAPACGRFLLGR